MQDHRKRPRNFNQTAKSGSGKLRFPGRPRFRAMSFPKHEAAMEITFTGMNESDLEQQIWEWRTNNPNLKMTKKHPIEMLPLRLSTPHSGQKIFAGHQVSLRVEYDEA